MTSLKFFEIRRDSSLRRGPSNPSEELIVQVLFVPPRFVEVCFEYKTPVTKSLIE